MVMVRSGMAPALFNRLHAVMTEVLGHPGVKERLSGDGADIAATSPQEAARFLRGEIERWGGVVRALGLKSE
jgi:tripartite-type tricarboxylate transporter receptor subunit TctC